MAAISRSPQLILKYGGYMMENGLLENEAEDTEAIEQLSPNSVNKSEKQEIVIKDSEAIDNYNPAETALERKITELVARTPLLSKVRFVAACISLLCAVICFSGVKFGLLLILASAGLIVIHVKNFPVRSKISAIPITLFALRLIIGGAPIWDAVFYGLVMQCITYALVIAYWLYILNIAQSVKALPEILAGLFVIETLYSFGSVFRGLGSSMLGFIFGLYCFAFMSDYLIGIYDSEVSTILNKAVKVVEEPINKRKNPK